MFHPLNNCKETLHPLNYIVHSFVQEKSDVLSYVLSKLAMKIMCESAMQGVIQGWGKGGYPPLAPIPSPPPFQL